MIEKNVGLSIQGSCFKLLYALYLIPSFWFNFFIFRMHLTGHVMQHEKKKTYKPHLIAVLYFAFSYFCCQVSMDVTFHLFSI